MKVYLAHSSKFDFKNEFYKPIRNSILNKKFDIIYLYEEASEPGSTLEIIKSSGLVIAEVSYPSMGEGIELGWANALKIPIICVHRKNQIASSFLNIISDNIFEYSDANEMIKSLSNAIKNIPTY